jgi:hypothetical protein
LISINEIWVISIVVDWVKVSVKDPVIKEVVGLVSLVNSFV